MWNHTSGLFDLEPRNEVLVRYDDNGNVIWAISFREFRSVSGNVGTRDSFAQDAWYQALPAAQDNVTSNTKFLGKSTLDADSGDGTTLHPYKITMSHEVALKAQETNNIIDVAADVGTVVTYKLEWWNGTNWVEIPRNQINDVKPANETGEQRYQLTITLNQGEPRVYILVKEAAKTGAKLDGAVNGVNMDTANKLFIVTTSPATTIATYLNQFKATQNGYIVWNVTLDGKVTPWNTREAMPDAFNIRNTNDIQYLTATVHNEDETVSTGEFYEGGSTATVIAGMTKNAMDAAKKLISDAGLKESDFTSELNAIKTGIEANDDTAAQLRAYLADGTYLDALKTAIANAQAIKLKTGTGIGAPGNGFPTAVLSDGRVLSSTAIGVTGDVTVNVTSKAGLQAGGEYIFTATSGAKTIDCGTVTVDGTAKTFTLNISGLTAGEWTLSVVKKATSAVTVSWTPNDSTVTCNGNPATPVMANPGDTVTFTVKANAGKYVKEVKAGATTLKAAESATVGVITEGTYTYTVPMNQTSAVTITVTTDNLVTPSETGGSATEVTKLKDAGVGVPVFNKASHVVTIPVTSRTTFENALKNGDGSVMTPEEARTAGYAVPPAGSGADNQLTYQITFELPSGTKRVKYQRADGSWADWGDGLNLTDMTMTEWATVAKWNGTSWVLNEEGTRFNFKYFNADDVEIGTQDWRVAVTVLPTP